MPRRLGDDPLTRTRKGTARTSIAETSPAAVAPDSGTSRTSSNDVFFQRRAQESDPVITSTLQHVTEAPEAGEIAEISEIAAFREVATVPPVQGAGEVGAEVGEANRTQEAAQDAEAPPASLVTPSENAESQTPNQEDGQPQPEKKGGFLKRLFNRFGK